MGDGGGGQRSRAGEEEQTTGAETGDNAGRGEEGRGEAGEGGEERGGDGGQDRDTAGREGQGRKEGQDERGGVRRGEGCDGCDMHRHFNAHTGATHSGGCVACYDMGYGRGRGWKGAG